MNLEVAEQDGIRTKIYEIRGMKVMLDRDLAGLYGVETRTLNQAVKRNSNRFPADFMFQLTREEWDSLRSQIVILNDPQRGKHSKYTPFAFSETGVSMLSSVLNSDFAVQVSVKIMRVFIELRRQIFLNPNYELLMEKIKRIEAEFGALRSEQQLLSYEVKSENALNEERFDGINRKFDLLGSILNDFQNAHLIIKRPDENTTPS